MSSAVTEDVENGSSSAFKDEDPGVTKSQDVSESSHGSELTGPDLSGEERETANCAGEPEVTALADASDRSVGSEFETSKQGTCLQKVSSCVFDGLPMTTRGHIATTSLL